ncbi:hypothetical protein [Kitasatospora sp. NPDC004289]
MNRMITTVRTALRRLAQLGNRQNHHTELGRHHPLPAHSAAMHHRTSPDFASSVGNVYL